MTLYYQIKVLITSRIFLTPLHPILKLWNEVKNEFRLSESMIFRLYCIILSIPRDWKTIMKKFDSE